MPRLQGQALASRKNRVGRGGSKREKGQREAALEELLASRMPFGELLLLGSWALLGPKAKGLGDNCSPPPTYTQEEAGRDGEQKAEPRAPVWAVLPEPGWD